MANGTIELTRNPTGQYLIGQIVWSSDSNGTEANTSTVTAQLQLQRNALNTTTGTFKGTFTVGSVTEAISWYGSLPSQTWVTIATITATVNHNTNGAGSCYLYAKINGPTTTTMEGTYVSGAQTVTLDTIPRYASIVSAPDFNDEENPTITYSNPAGNSVSALEACISLDGSKADVAYRSVSKTGTSYTFNLTETERNVLRAATTGSNSRTVRFFIRSTIGSSTQTSSLSKTFTIKNPKPTINPTITDSNNTTYNLTGNRNKLVRYYSNAQITIGAAAVKQATLTDVRVTCGDKSLTTNGTINAVEANNFVFTATDNRGNTTTETVTPSFVSYVKLTCGLENNIPDTSGRITVRVTGNYFNGSFGSRNNSLKVYYRYKSNTGSFGNWVSMSVSYSGNTYTATANLTGLDYQTSYVFEAYAVDALATVYSASKTVIAEPVFDWSKTDFKFNVPVTLGKGTGSTRLTAQDNLNNVTANGWYDWLSGKAPANAPSGQFTGTIYSLRVFSRGYACIQECCDTTNYRGCVLQRTLNDDGATEWEWVNPPMVTGYEFRTTERYNDKPVYRRVVSVGSLPANSTKTITVSGMYYPFSITGMTSGNRSIPHAGYITVRGSYQEIEVATTIDYSSTTATLLVKYLKEAP